MTQDETIDGEDFADSRPFDDDLHGCQFLECDFSDADLSDLLLEECRFENCNLSMASLSGARLIDVAFEDCKLMGVDFAACSDFGFSVSFAACNLRYGSFSAKKMAGTDFGASALAQVDFTHTDLEGADLSECRLDDALFASTNLTGADLRGARNFTIDPELNRIEGAKISRDALAGLLTKYDLDID